MDGAAGIAQAAAGMDPNGFAEQRRQPAQDGPRPLLKRWVIEPDERRSRHSYESTLQGTRVGPPIQGKAPGVPERLPQLHQGSVLRDCAHGRQGLAVPGPELLPDATQLWMGDNGSDAS
jgi:hypothetical protein